MISCRLFWRVTRMASFKLSGEADADIKGITDYTASAFGSRQAIKYSAALTTTFELLSRFPRIGLPSYDLRDGLYHFPHKSHVIFYTQAHDHILIVRVLHARADFKRFF